MACLLLTVSVNGFAGQHNEPDVPQLTLVVCDQARVGNLTLTAARENAVYVFQKAGVEITWLATCTLPAKFGYLLIVITPRAPHSWTTADAVGFAPAQTGPIRRAYIFSERLNDMMQSYAPLRFRDFRAGNVLGLMIAHEVAHLLIGGNNHTETGIMRARWGHTEWLQGVSGRLLFQSDQAQAIQMQLRLLYPRSPQ